MTIYRLCAEIPGLQESGVGYSLDPTIVLLELIDVFGTDLTRCIDDLAWKDFDYFQSRRTVSGAIKVAENDARRRGPIWAFRIRTGTEQIVEGHAERYVVSIQSEQPIPASIAERFEQALRQLRFEPLRLYREEGNHYDREQVTLGEPSWEAIDLLPRQGDWSEEDYLRLDVNRHVELVDGRIEVPPHPTDRHQEITGNLYLHLRSYLQDSGAGKVILPPFPIRLRKRTFRMPDLTIMRRENSSRRQDRFWDRADLVVEVASNESFERDRWVKDRDYAQAVIPEYWIAEQRHESLTILTLDAGATEYREAGRYAVGDMAASVLLEGLVVDVAGVFRTDEADA